MPEEDRLTLIASATNHGGRVSEGYRDAVNTGRLSPETVQRYIVNPADKSYVPPRLRKVVTKDVRLVEDHHHGPRQAELNGAYIDRDWSEVDPGDWWQGDDLTSPVVFWEDTPNGLFLGRGQLIAMIDVRSLNPLGWLLHSDKGYLARSIRSLFTKCHDVHGLPRRGCYFENGMWKNARLLAGRRGDDVPLSLTENGLREFCEFRHAKLPRGKVIERVFGLFQNRLEGLPGYVGRDERNDRYERVQKQILDVNAGRCHPSKYFMEKRALMAVYQEIWEAYAAEPQQGKMLPGISPRELYEQRQTDSIVSLSAEHRYLLANHQMPVKITRNGIRLPASMGGGVYRNEQTGRLIGQTMLCWVDVDNLDFISITDRKRCNPFVVECAKPLPAMDATQEEIECAVAQLNAHNLYAKTLYQIIRPRLQAGSFRPVISDQKSIALGREMAAQAGELRQRQSAVERTRRTVHGRARELAVPVKPTNDPGELNRQDRALKLMQEALPDPE